MVLLLSLMFLYQEKYYEVDLRYGDRDITSGSLVSCCSKDNMAGDEPLPDQFGTNFVNFGLTNLKSNKEKCSSVVLDR